ncbi:hypothetical protein ACRS6P_16585 [Pseudomonas aeruginosa]
MQVETPEVGAEKATTPRYDTIVIRGATGQSVPKEVDGGKVVAWSRGHELAAMDALEAFISDLADGNCHQPTYLTQGAANALNLMRRRRAIGWDADETVEHPPADWRTAVARAVATASKVFEDDGDEVMSAIRYMEALLLANEPEQQKPFMFAQLQDGDVMDWTQDPNLAEEWEQQGYAVAKLYAAAQGGVA